MLARSMELGLSAAREVHEMSGCWRMFCTCLFPVICAVLIAFIALKLPFAVLTYSVCGAVVNVYGAAKEAYTISGMRVYIQAENGLQGRSSRGLTVPQASH